MTAFTITIQLNDLDDDLIAAQKSAESFCQCVHNLLPNSKYEVEVELSWVTATYMNVSDDLFQSMEEIIGQTIWDIRQI